MTTTTVILQIRMTFMSSIHRFNNASVSRQIPTKVEKHTTRTSSARGQASNSVRAKPGKIKALRGSSKENGTTPRGRRNRNSRKSGRRSKNNNKTNLSKNACGANKKLAKTRKRTMSGYVREKRRIITLRISVESVTRLNQMPSDVLNGKRCTKNGTLILKVTFILASEGFRTGP